MAPHRRRPPAKPPRPVWLVLCEGRVTEEQYFLGFRRRTDLVLEIQHCSGGPLIQVKQAKRRWEEAPKTWDRVWCVFDVDDRPQEVKQAEDLARSVSWLSLAVSNPCIELWALLHFQEQTGWLSGGTAQRLFEQHCPGYLPKKRLPIERLFELEPQAIARARKLTLGENPSTGIPDLIEALLAAPRDRG